MSFLRTLCTSFFIATHCHSAPLITEFLADNATGLRDEDGDQPDWIEIHNPDATPLDLSGWHLTDRSSDPTRWTFPSLVLEPNDFLVIFASGKNRTAPASELHTDFSLSRSGGYLALVSPAGDLASSFQYSTQREDVSFGPTRAGSERTLVGSSSPAKALIPTSNDDSAIGTTWRNNQPAFDDSSWQNGTLGVGFERSSGFEEEFGIDVEAAWAVNSTIYIRVPIATNLDPSSVQSLTLRMKYDDGFAAFLNGRFVAGANNPATLEWNSDADGDVTDAEALQFQNFDLSASIPNLVASGNVLAIHGMNRFSNSSDLLIRPELIATLTNPVPPTMGYFETPTPGIENPLTNAATILGDTRFEVGRGFFETAFTEIITITDPGTTIIYTTDGSIPNLANGTRISAPNPITPAQASIPISTTTVLRAIAVRDDALPTNVDTQTYLFPAHVLTQSGSGQPQPSNNTSLWDYQMDPNIVADPRFPDLAEDLKSLPTLSVSLPSNDLWGDDGIYANPRQSGAAWERACSVEYLLPDGSPGFQQDAGLRIQGAGSRFRDLGKKSLRIAFRKTYGQAKLDYPLFGPGAAHRPDNIVLRGAYFDSWTVHTSGSGNEGIGRRNALLFRDEFGRQTHQAMGADPVVQGNWAHLYFNGLYWGVYNLHERIDEHFAEDRFGGDASEYDVLKQSLRGQPNGSPPEVVNGDLIAWNTLLRTLNEDIASPSIYQSVRQQLDVDSFIDYLILNFWGANLDWPHNNWYATRHRPSNGPFTILSWDVENFIFATTEIGQLNTSVNNSPGIIWDRLRLNEEFMISFADQVHLHCFNNGSLTPERNIDRFEEIANTIRPAMNTESARWGDTREEPPMNSFDQFEPLLSQKISSYFPARTNLFLNQLRSANLYPNTAPPLLSQHGGLIVPDSTITITNPNQSGTAFFTTDGTDPRLPDGNPSPSAQVHAEFTVNAPLPLLARVKSDNGEWSPLARAEFQTGLSPATGDLVVTEIHYHPAEPNPDEIVSGFSDQDDFEFIELSNTQSHALDLTNVSFTTGIRFNFSTLPPAKRHLPGHSRLVLVRNTAAFSLRYPAITPLGEYQGSLANSGETLTLSLNDSPYQSVTYNDKSPWPEPSDGLGFSLTLTTLNSDPTIPLNWQPSPNIDGSPLSSDISPFVGNPDDDDNQDGINNLLHFALTNTTAPPIQTTMNIEGLTPTFTFPRNLAARLFYTVEHSVDLENWSNLNQVNLLEITPPRNGLSFYTYQSPLPPSTGPHYFRLRVGKPN